MASFTIGEALSFGWTTTTRNFGFLASLVLLLFAVLYATNFLARLLPIIGPLATLAIEIILNMGILVIALKFVDGQSAQFRDVYGTVRPFWRFLGASVLFSLLVLAGLVLLVVPGVMVAIAMQFFSYLIVDRNLGVIDSLQQSFSMTRGVRWKLLGFSLVLALINIIGALLLGIGLLWSIPLSWLATAYVYRTLVKQAGRGLAAAATSGA
jgi:uncharacterized membrane protein